MGLDPERLYTAMKRFEKLGERGEHTRRVPMYQVLKLHAAWWSTPRHPYHLLANAMVKLSELLPEAAAPADPELVQGAHPRAGAGVKERC